LPSAREGLGDLLCEVEQSLMIGRRQRHTSILTYALEAHNVCP
jgi:hypothetical protein